MTNIETHLLQKNQLEQFICAIRSIRYHRFRSASFCYNEISYEVIKLDHFCKMCFDYTMKL